MDLTQQSRKIAVVIVAGGTGSRFGPITPKQYIPLNNKPLIRHSIETFLAAGLTDIVVVIHPDHKDAYHTAIQGLESIRSVPGGKTRAESTLAGLKALQSTAPDYVLIHDAARPFVAPSLIKRVIAELAANPGCIPAIQATDTIKLATNNKYIQQTLPRDSLWCAQTPQGFHYPVIMDCFTKTTNFDFTDEAALFESFGIPVKIVQGSEENIKITFSGDLKGK